MGHGYALFYRLIQLLAMYLVALDLFIYQFREEVSQYPFAMVYW